MLERETGRGRACTADRSLGRKLTAGKPLVPGRTRWRVALACLVQTITVG